MDGVFVSYRRDDAAGWAGRLTADLRARFPGREIFQDIAAIRPGEDFIQAIDRAIQGCRIVLVLIGPDWVTAAGADGTRRLHQPDDPVRLEVRTALERPVLTVIPVLLGEAGMPAPRDLPADLHPLLRLNAAHISDRRWDFDIAQLAGQLAEGPRPKRVARRRLMFWGAAGVIALLAAGAAGWMRWGALWGSPGLALNGRWESEMVIRQQGGSRAKEFFDLERRGDTVIGVNWKQTWSGEAPEPRRSQDYALMEGRLERGRITFCLHLQSSTRVYKQCYDGILSGDEISFAATNYIDHPFIEPLLERFTARRTGPLP